MFSKFARFMSSVLGSSKAFVFAILIIVGWALTGPLFGFSDTWQLIINTATTLITFLMVFIIQNTQNHDTAALQLKLDEIIRSLKNADNQLLDIEDLSDEELQKLHQKYELLAAKMK